MNKEFLTINEVAELVNVSPQYLYSQFNKRFKEFSKMINRKKYFHCDILKEFDGEGQNKEQTKENSTDLNKVVELLEKQVELLTNQLAEKDSQIQTLQQLLNQQQQLHLQTQSQLKLLESKEKKKFWSWFRKEEQDNI